MMKPLTFSALMTVGLPLFGALIFLVIWFERFHWEENAVPAFVTGLGMIGLISVLATPVPFCFAVYYFLKDLRNRPDIG